MGYIMTKVGGKSQKFLQNFFFQQTGRIVRSLGRTMKMIPITDRGGMGPIGSQLWTQKKFRNQITITEFFCID
jgi:hypothetical protein